MDLNAFASHPEATLDPSLFWEYDMSRFDYDAMSSIVVQRVVERGAVDDWYAALNLYGKDGMRRIIKDLPYLSDRDARFVSILFDIPHTEMACYIRKQSRQSFWNS